jgi:hypothetical protein
MGIRATQIINESHLDLYVIPGEEYLCSDNVRLLVYKLNQSMPKNLSSEQAIPYAKKNGGWVMAIDLSRRVSQKFNKMKNEPGAPNAIEIYNAVKGGYHDTNVDYPKFISSAAKSPAEFDEINVFTLIDRKELEEMGLIPENIGVEYTPRYLNPNPATSPQDTPQETPSKNPQSQDLTP